MAQMDLVTRKIFFKVIYFGLNTGENTRSIDLLKEKAKHAQNIHLIEPNRFILQSFSTLTLPNVGAVTPVFELVSLSSEDIQDPQKTCPFHLADAVILVVNPKTSLNEKNIQCFQKMKFCLNHYQRTLENISFIIQYSSEREIQFFQLRDVEKKLQYDEFVSFSVNLKTGEGLLETLEEIASDLFDVFSSISEESSTLDTLLVVPASANENSSVPSIAAETSPPPPPVAPFPSMLPIYGDIPPQKGPPSYRDLPTSLPNYGQPNPKFPTYGDLDPTKKTPGFSYGIPPTNEPFSKKHQPPNS